ncbi:MAG: hypothetical protein OEU92_25990 [Alphaproteobacteria bacterium]|nr:hypothetical protein [Alphaproteobacteria bacterium]
MSAGFDDGAAPSPADDPPGWRNPCTLHQRTRWTVDFACGGDCLFRLNGAGHVASDGLAAERIRRPLKRIARQVQERYLGSEFTSRRPG